MVFNQGYASLYFSIYILCHLSPPVPLLQDEEVGV